MKITRKEGKFPTVTEKIETKMIPIENQGDKKLEARSDGFLEETQGEVLSNCVIDAPSFWISMMIFKVQMFMVQSSTSSRT